jgi:hypothetical protein
MTHKNQPSIGFTLGIGSGCVYRLVSYGLNCTQNENPKTGGSLIFESFQKTTPKSKGLYNKGCVTHGGLAIYN